MTSSNSAIDLGVVSEGRDFDFHFVFTTYGVTVKIESNDERLLGKAKTIAKKAFLDRLEFIEDKNIAIDFTLGIAVSESTVFELWENGRFRSETPNESVLTNFFTSYLRVTVAERSKEWVFVHAGVVGHNGRAIVIPGNSFSGKTTLVAELVKRGAEYLSDEYAVFDSSGLVYPFPRDLSIRVNGDRRNVVRTKAEDLGGRNAISPLGVGLAIFTEYIPGSSWEPETISLGNGIKELVPHTISVRLNTLFALKVLNTGLSRAIILKGVRPEAGFVAENIMSFVENDANWSAMTLT